MGIKKTPVTLVKGEQMRGFLLVFCMIGLQAVSVHAATFGNISFGGTGCRGDGNGIHAKLGSGGKRLLVYTPDMQVDLQSSRLDRKACAIAVPLELAEDERLVIGRPSIFGKELLETGSLLTVAAEVFIAGAQGPEVRTEIQGGPGHEVRDFYKMATETMTSECGQVLNLRANASLLARGPGSNGGVARLRGLAFDVRVEKCPVN